MKKWLSIAILASAMSCSRVESKIGDLHSSDIDKRGNAARALGDFGDKRAVDPLIDVLEHDSDLYVRRDAAEALGKLGDARAIEPLCRALGDRDYPVVAPAAAKALGAFGSAAFDPVLAQFRSGDKAHRYGAAIALGEIGDKRAIAPLLETKTSDFQESEAVSGALAKLRDPREIVAELAAQLHDPDHVKREAAANALAKTKNDGAVAPLVAALEDPDSMVRMRAAQALGELGEIANKTEVATAIARHLTDSDSSAAKAAAAALMSIGTEGRTQSLTALKSSDANIRLIALEPLDYRGSTMLMHPIINALHDPDPRIRMTAAKCLRGFVDREAIDALLAALNDPAAEVAAAASLDNVDDSRVADALMARLRQRKYAVIAAAIAFYVRRGEPGTEPILIDALNATGGQSMAELFMNCGNQRLSQAAMTWAREHGYDIRQRLPGGDASGGTRWGSG